MNLYQVLYILSEIEPNACQLIGLDTVLNQA